MQTKPFDADVVRWGLQDLILFPSTDENTTYISPATYRTSDANDDSNAVTYYNHNANEIRTTEYGYSYANEGVGIAPMAKSPRVSVTSDELIAHALQEELTSLAAAEEAASGGGDNVDQNLRSAVLSQDWTSKHSHDSADCNPEVYGRREDSDAHEVREVEKQELPSRDEPFMAPTSDVSGSSSDRRHKSRGPDYELYQHGDDDELNLSIALALSEEDQRHDEEVAKRLNKFDSIKHVPRVNTEFPTLDVASLDHQRLVERLVLYGLSERKIQGDGNCQFRALSDQLYKTPENHKYVRKAVVQQEWRMGDHVTLQAAADHYGVKIWLVTSFKDTAFIEILPAYVVSNRVIHLSFWAEIHYNSIYLDGGAVPDNFQRYYYLDVAQPMFRIREMKMNIEQVISSHGLPPWSG